MTVYVFADPLREAIDYVDAKIGEYPAGTTVTTDFPTALTHMHVQVAWDGTPGERQQAETAAIRATVWAPKGHGHDANNLASQVHRDLLEMATATVWRTTHGTGRLPGVDPDTGLPFCTFTVNADIRPATS